MKARPLVAMEPVAGPCINENLAVGPLGAHRIHVAHGDSAVFGPVVQLRGAARHLIGEVGDAPAIKAHRGGKTGQTGGRQKRHAATQTKPDDAHLSDIRHGLARRLGIAQIAIPVGIGDEAPRLLDLRRRITGLEIALDAIEQGRRDGRIAGLGQPVADGTDVRVDAKNLLDHDDGATGGLFGVGPVGPETMTVGGGERKIRHG